MSGDGERKPAPGLAGRTRGLKISSIAIVILVAFACSFLIWKVSERLFGDKEQPANAGLSDSARLALGGEWSSGQQSGGGRKESRSSADDRLMHLEPVYLSEPWPVTQPIDDDLFPNLSGASVKFGKTGGNTVSGTVSFDGEPPAERVIPMDPESLRHRVGLPSPTTRFYVVSESGRVGDVVVYLEGKLPSIRSTNDFGPLLIDHVGSMKTPYVSATGIGQTILVSNSDPIQHTFHVTPHVNTQNQESNHTLGPSDNSTFSLSFIDPEMFIQMKCDVHPWEFAYVSIFDHYYFDVTGPDGMFSISDVPPGEYTLHVDHRKLGRKSRDIEVTQGESKQVKIVFDNGDSYIVNGRRVIRPVSR